MPVPKNQVPPIDYSNRVLDVYVIAKGTPLYRCYDTNRNISGSIYFGIGENNRFNDEKQNVGVMYIGETPEAALTESLLHDGMDIDYISEIKINSISMVEIIFNHDITLVNYNANGLKKNGVASFIFSCPHEISRKWSAAIIENTNNYTGIYFPCNHDNQYYSIALFNREELNYETYGLGKLFESNLKKLVEEFLLEHNVGVN